MRCISTNYSSVLIINYAKDYGGLKTSVEFHLSTSKEITQDACYGVEEELVNLRFFPM